MATRRSIGDMFGDTILGGSNKRTFSPTEQAEYQKRFPSLVWGPDGTPQTWAPKGPDLDDPYSYQNETPRGTQDGVVGGQRVEADLTEPNFAGQLGRFGAISSAAKFAASFLPGAGAPSATGAAATGATPAQIGAMNTPFTGFGASAGGGVGGGTAAGATAGGSSLVSKIKSLAGDGGMSWKDPRTWLGLGQLGLGAAGAAMQGPDRTQYSGAQAPQEQLKALLQQLSNEMKAQQTKRSQPVTRRAAELGLR